MSPPFSAFVELFVRQYSALEYAKIRTVLQSILSVFFLFSSSSFVTKINERGLRRSKFV